MRNPVRNAALLLLLAAAQPFASAATGTAVASDSTVTVSGGGLPVPETYRLAQVYGDWFATPTDAHAALTMRTLPGAHQAQVGIEWDGKSLTQTIDAAKSDVHSSRMFSFSLHLSGAGAYSQDAQLRGSDAITIQITRMDNLTLEATFGGTATGTGALKVSGVVKLHREATAEKPTGMFGNCDPAIHDKLAGAEWRSPSGCEVIFDAYARKGLTAAIEPVIDGLTAQGWKVISSVEAQSLTSIPRHTESKPFQLTEQSMHQGGAFFVSLGLPESSPIYQRLSQAAMAEMQKAITAAQAGKALPMDEATDAARALDENTKIGISVAINLSGAGISNFKGGHTVTPLPGGGYAIEVPYAQSPGGGDITAAQHVTCVFLGAWGPAPASTQSGGDENIQVKGALNPAKLLAVQNIRIRIQGGPAQAQQVIKLINWNALQALMEGK
jgi:hypothetical protein